MSEALPEGVSRKDFEELRSTVQTLADAIQQQRDAETSREKQAAKEEVKEAKADLDTLAKEMGVDPAKLREAAENAKRDAEKERLRPILAELLDEELASGDNEEGGDGSVESPEATAEKDGDTSAEPAADDPPPPPEDSAPVAEHWSERKIGGLLG